MSILDYIWQIITGLAVLAIAGIFKWRFSKKETEPNSDTLLEITIEGPEEILNDIFIEYEEVNIDDEEEEPLIKTTDIESRIEGLPLAVQKEKACIEMVGYVLEYEFENIAEKEFAKALSALAGGNISKADKVFAKIEKREKPVEKRAARIALARGIIAEQQVRWKDAAKHYRNAASAYSHCQTLIFAQKLFINMGDYDSALAFSINAKKIASTTYGEESLQYATILGNLAETYQALGNYEKAADIYLKALNICTEHLEDVHHLTIPIINNIGLIFELTRDYKRAASAFNAGLLIKEKTLGKGHVDTAIMINNLATVYHLQGKDKKAESFFLRAIKIRDDALGDNNYENAITYNNLAGLYEKQKRYNDAETCYQKSIEIFKTKTNPKHPKSLYQKVIKIFKLKFEPDHPDIKKIKANYKNLKKLQANAHNTTSQ